MIFLFHLPRLRLQPRHMLSFSAAFARQQSYSLCYAPLLRQIIYFRQYLPRRLMGDSSMPSGRGEFSWQVYNAPPPRGLLERTASRAQQAAAIRFAATPMYRCCSSLFSARLNAGFLIFDCAAFEFAPPRHVYTDFCQLCFRPPGRAAAARCFTMIYAGCAHQAFSQYMVQMPFMLAFLSRRFSLLYCSCHYSD